MTKSESMAFHCLLNIRIVREIVLDRRKRKKIADSLLEDKNLFEKNFFPHVGQKARSVIENFFNDLEEISDGRRTEI